MNNKIYRICINADYDINSKRFYHASPRDFRALYSSTVVTTPNNETPTDRLTGDALARSLAVVRAVGLRVHADSYGASLYPITNMIFH